MQKYTREELNGLFLEELKNYGGFLTVDRYNWLSHIEDASFYKLLVYSGYLMAMRDSGNNIGDMRVILEYIIDAERGESYERV